MSGNRRARAENVLLAAGITSVTAILFSYFILGARPNAAEIIAWSASTMALIVVTRVYGRTIIEQRETIHYIDEQLLLKHLPVTRKCSVCEFSADWFSVLMHEGAVHGL